VAPPVTGWASPATSASGSSAGTVSAVPPVVVVATVTPQPGRTDEVVAAIGEVVPVVHREAGCEKYALHRAADPDRLVFVERWASRDALAAHGRAEHMRALGSRLQGLVAGPTDVVVLDPVPLGDADQGRV